MAGKRTNEDQGFKRLKEDLKAGTPGRLYLFSGEEHFLRDRYLARLRRAVLDGPAQEFNDHRFTPENMDLQMLSDAVEAFPMMAQRSLVQVEDCDLSSLSGEDAKALAGILSDIPDFCTVVLVFDTVEYKWKTASGSSGAAEGQKQLREILSGGCAVDFRTPDTRELIPWIRNHFRPHGKVIGDRTCEQLVFVTGGSMAILASEIEKLAAYAQGQEITPQDVQAVVVPVLDAQIYTMTDAIVSGNGAAALGQLRTLLQMQEEPIVLLAAVANQLRRIFYVKQLLGAGQGEQEAAELLKVATGRKPHSYVVSKTVSAARRLPEAWLARAILACTKADQQLKSSGDAQQSLELLILRLAQEVRCG